MKCNNWRIRYFREKNNLTQKALGEMLGFPESSADVRIAQYETGTRAPREDVIKKLAEVFDISQEALTVPDIESVMKTIHLLFEMEDLYGVQPREIDGKTYLVFDPSKLQGRSKRYSDEILRRIQDWIVQNRKLRNGEITEAAYDEWRYNYPRYLTDGSPMPMEDYIKNLKYSVFPEARNRDNADALAEQVKMLSAQLSQIMQIMNQNQDQNK